MKNKDLLKLMLLIIVVFGSCSKKNDAPSYDRFYGKWYGIKGCIHCDTIVFTSPNLFNSVIHSTGTFNLISGDTIALTEATYAPVHYGYRFDSSENLIISKYECSLISGCYDVTFQKN